MSRSSRTGFVGDCCSQAIRTRNLAVPPTTSTRKGRHPPNPEKGRALRKSHHRNKVSKKQSRMIRKRGRSDRRQEAQPSRIPVRAMEAGLNKSTRKTGQNSGCTYLTDINKRRKTAPEWNLNTRKHRIIQKWEPELKELFGTNCNNLLLCQGPNNKKRSHSAALCLTCLDFHYSKNNLLILLSFLGVFITTELWK